MKSGIRGTASHIFDDFDHPANSFGRAISIVDPSQDFDLGQPLSRRECQYRRISSSSNRSMTENDGRSSFVPDSSFSHIVGDFLFANESSRRMQGQEKIA